MTYWEQRQHLKYLQEAITLLRTYVAGPKLLDVGGGLQKGCAYLDWLPEFDRTAIDIEVDKGIRLPGVRCLFEDFLTWTPDARYDAVICLQVVEHVRDAATFCQKLLACADIAVISVPYCWRKGACKHHVHDPVDESKMLSWTGRKPLESRIVVDGRSSRLVCVYEN
jgi:hypothetical protein